MTEKELARIKKRFGAHIKGIRKTKDLSLLEADYGSEMNESNVSKYENGKRDPRLSTIVKLARMLNVHPKELLDFEFE